MLPIAQQVKEQILTHYENGYINHADLIKHLTNNQIDSFCDVIEYSSFHKPLYDYYPAVFEYEDNSKLIVTNTHIVAEK